MASVWDYSTTAASNNSASPDGAPEGMAPSGVNNAMREHMARSKGAVTAVTASGTDTYTADLDPAPTSLTTGMTVHITFTNANTSTTPTLNLNSLGAKTIVKNGSAALLAGDIPAGHEGVLRYNGTNMVLLNPAESGWRLLSSQSASSSATIDFASSIFDGTYDRYMIVGENVKPATDSVNFSLRVGTGATPTYQTTGYTFGGRAQSPTGGTDFGSDSGLTNDTSRIYLTGAASTSSAVGNASNEHISFVAEFSNPDGSDFPLFLVRSAFVNPSGLAAAYHGSGQYGTAGAITAVRFFFNSGNIASGTFRLYGLRK